MKFAISALDRKLLRDVWHLRGQVLAVALVVMCGVAVFLTMRGTYETLVNERADYYARYRFGDVFAGLKRAPESVAAQIAGLPGVQTVDTGIALEVTLDVPGLAEPATGQVISVPDHGRPLLNDLYIRRGRYIEPGARDEVLVSQAFAEANGLEPGARLGAVINGRWQRLTVVGIANSPEFIYVLRPSNNLPDHKRYGIVWMGREAVGHAYDMAGAFNRVVLGLSRGASEPGIIEALDRLLERYGSLGAYGREDQPSHKVISDEIDQNKVYGFVVSAIFLGVAAFIINIVLTRLVATQRDQIAVLKAFGYANRTVGLHYLELALVAVFLGVVLGLGLAAWLGGLLADMYRDFFSFPHFAWSVSGFGLAVGIGVSFVAAAVGAFGAVARAVRLPPAEAMRPEPPARFRPTIVERLGFQRWLSIGERIIVRNLERRPWKAVLSMTGIALAVAIIIAGRYGGDALDRIMDVQFRASQREDAVVEFVTPLSARARHAVGHLAGVTAAEPFRFVPVRLRFGHRERRAGILGLTPGGELRAIVGLDYRRFEPPPDGLLMSVKLAQSLGAVPGDMVTVEVLEGRRIHARLPLVGQVDDLVGVSAYMALPSLNRMLREGGALSGAFVRVDETKREAFFEAVKATPAIQGTSVKEATLANFRDVIARSLSIQTVINVLFASIIAFGVVYNSVRIALSERGHELASLRVLGFTQREIAFMLLGEQALLTLLAIPVGFALGYGICASVAASINATQDTFRLPLVLSGETFAFAFFVVALASLVSGLLVWGRLQRLDLVAVLKTRE